MANQIALRIGQAVDALAHRLGYRRSVPGGVQWLWPSGGWGNGDRGPPGSWQRNLGEGFLGQELIAFSAVYACINSIASDISKLPPIVYQVDPETDAKTPQRTDYYVRLMEQPNSFQTHVDFMYAFVQSYLFQGNTYCLCRRNARDEINALYILNPHRVQPLIVREDGSIFYRCAEDHLAGLAPGTVVPARDMIHHRLPLIPGFPLTGVTPIFAAAASSSVGLKILQNSQQFFANAARPSGMLVTEQSLSPETAARYKQEWEQNYRGEGTGKVALLGGGMKWEPLTITAQDAQLIEQLRWSVEDVGRVFRVPPFMLGDMTKISYRNNEQLVRAYLTNCLGYHIRAIEQRFKAAFEFGPDYSFELDLAAMLRTEIDVRFAAYREALNAGWQSINEVRAQEGLEPVKGGETPRVQVQYVPIDKPATPMPPPGSPGPGEPATDPNAPLPEPASPTPEETPQGASFEIDRLRLRANLRERFRRAA
jgi:HK97 family phage portal protein